MSSTQVRNGVTALPVFVKWLILLWLLRTYFQNRSYPYIYFMLPLNQVDDEFKAPCIDYSKWYQNFWSVSENDGLILRQAIYFFFIKPE